MQLIDAELASLETERARLFEAARAAEERAIEAHDAFLTFDKRWQSLHRARRALQGE